MHNLQWDGVTLWCRRLQVAYCAAKLLLPEATTLDTGRPVAWPHDDLLAQTIQQWYAGRQAAGATTSDAAHSLLTGF